MSVGVIEDYKLRDLRASHTRGVSIWFSDGKNVKICTKTDVNSKTFRIYVLSRNVTILENTNICLKHDLFAIPKTQRLV
jgi:hypothetical protein